jgi:hypothetical protein
MVKFAPPVGVLLSGNVALEHGDGAEVLLLLSPGDVVVQNGAEARRSPCSKTNAVARTHAPSRLTDRFLPPPGTIAEVARTNSADLCRRRRREPRKPPLEAIAPAGSLCPATIGAHDICRSARRMV